MRRKINKTVQFLGLDHMKIFLNIDNNIFEYKYGEHPYIEYFNEIKLNDYITKYEIFYPTYKSKQISLFINHKIFGITTLKY